jgi:hypothetical protein
LPEKPGLTLQNALEGAGKVVMDMGSHTACPTLVVTNLMSTSYLYHGIDSTPDDPAIAWGFVVTIKTLKLHQPFLVYISAATTPALLRPPSSVAVHLDAQWAHISPKIPPAFIISLGTGNALNDSKCCATFNLRGNENNPFLQPVFQVLPAKVAKNNVLWWNEDGNAFNGSSKVSPCGFMMLIDPTNLGSDAQGNIIQSVTAVKLTVMVQTYALEDRDFAQQLVDVDTPAY